jgi:hypothetical protein
LYKCYIAIVKRNSSLPSTIRGYKSYIYMIPSLTFHQRRLVERLVARLVARLVKRLV